jgi:hypothetical protein
MDNPTQKLQKCRTISKYFFDISPLFTKKGLNHSFCNGIDRETDWMGGSLILPEHFRGFAEFLKS